MLQVRKVIEHIYEKILGQGSEVESNSAVPAATTTPGGSGGSNSTHEKSDVEMEDVSSVAEEKVELLCNDQVRIYNPII